MTEPQNLDRALSAARKTLGGDELPPAEVGARFDALYAELEKAPSPERPTTAPPRTFWTRARTTAVLLLAAALAVVVVVVVRRPRELTYTVRGGTADGDYIRTTEAGTAQLSFSDDSVLDLAASSRLRVVGRTSHGAQLVLEGGRVTAHITHTDTTDWTIGAGPYAVHVVGTTFEVVWNPDSSALEVRVDEGTVSVSGPGADAVVRAPQTIHMQAGLVEVPSATPTATPTTTPSATPTATPEIPVVTVDAGVAAARSADPPPVVSWSSRVAKGEFDAVVTDAEKRGVDVVLSSAPASDLGALADAARYTGKLDLAKRALGAERSRFPGSPAAFDATFLLGKISEDGDHAPAAAIAYYNEYLAAAPSGTYEQESLGRKMMLERTQAPDEAKKSATRYLERHPQGAYAAAARKITGP